MLSKAVKLELLSDWLEGHSAGAWARAALQEPAPMFGTTARNSLRLSIADDLARIERLKDYTRQDRKRIMELWELVGQKRARLAPIRLMPNEILSKIFLEWLEIRDLPIATILGSFTHPSVIMQVCRRWTSCVYSTPAIWTHGEYMIRVSDIKHENALFDLKSYFERSRSRGLKVRFINGNAVDDTHRIWTELMMPYLAQMKSIALDTLHSVSSLGIAARLTDVSLCGIHVPKGYNPIIVPTIQTLQFLRTVSDPPIVCPALVAFEAEDCCLSYSYMQSLSSSSPLLERIRFSMTTVEYPVRPASLSFSALKVLKFGYYDDGDDIPDCFSATSNICKIGVYFQEDLVPEMFLSVSLGSFSALVYLSLTIDSSMVGIGSVDVQNFHDWMAHAENLNNLKLTYEPDNDGYYLEDFDPRIAEIFLNPLLIAKRVPPLFPRLKNLTVKKGLYLDEALTQLLVDRATDAERLEAGYPKSNPSAGITQRPCRVTLVNYLTLPDMESVGLREFQAICDRQSDTELDCS